MAHSPTPGEPHALEPIYAQEPGTAKPTVFYSKDLQMKTTCQEFLIYILFLIDLCTLSFGMVNKDMYNLNNALSNLLLENTVSETDTTNFKSISTMTDFWKFAEGPLLEGLFWNTWYNNQTISQDRSFIYYENLLLGVAQIRQLKVGENTCRVHSFFKTFTNDCFTAYHYKFEDTAEFGLKNASEWRYKSPIFVEWHWGHMGTYSSGGFIANLSHTKESSLMTIQHLKENSWLTRGSRVVFIDFSVYNPNVNLFCVARLVTEFPATGGATPSWQFYAVKLLRYVSVTDYFFACCEVIFCLFICAFIFQEIMKAKKQKLEYIKCMWNWLDISLIAIFKFITFNKTMSQLSSTLSRCAKDIMGFAIMFFIIFFSYAQLGFLIFGSQIDEFSSFANCVFTQFRIILGDFDFADIEKADRVLGPLYFISFVFFIFFVLLNMFLAIINDTYTEVKADFSGIHSEFKMWDIIQQNYEQALLKLRLKKAAVEDINKSLFESGLNLSFHRLHEDMKAKGYSVAETEDILKTYDLDKDLQISAAEGKFAKEDLKEQEETLTQQQKLQKRHFKNMYSLYEEPDLRKNQKDTTNIVTQQEYQKLVRLIADLEKKLCDVTMKVEGLPKKSVVEDEQSTSKKKKGFAKSFSKDAE
ncbi:polycystin-2-like protein 2 isoform X2 [Ascaphus truei]|uniref:polycystin-2-like protein 2 isoform X2 n=1 Tax=Ascaphus truei TaxID=8439 RepID=UPI003F593D76